VTGVAAVAEQRLTARLTWRLPWWGAHATIVGLVLFVPIRRYHFGTALGFELEPYRVLLAGFLLAYFASRIVEQRPAGPPSGLARPIALLLLAVLGSELGNLHRIGSQQLQPDVTKSVVFLLGFLVLIPLALGTLSTRQEIDRVLGVLVAGGAVVAVLSIVEQRTGWNAFDHLGSLVPGVGAPVQPWLPTRGGRLRVLGSAQHPIALGALFAVLMPICLYLFERYRRRLFLGCGGVIGLAALATVSRTAIIMIAVEIIVLFWLRPALRRLWPIAIPLVLVAHVALPGTIGALRQAFFPKGGLVAQQREGAHTRGSGRIADLGPALGQVSVRPLFGDGYGTRIVDVKPRQNAPILDDQWLGLLLDVGLVGAAAFLWLIIRSVRRMVRACRSARGPDATGLAALAATTAAYAVGMLTFDAITFVQITFVFFLLIGIGCVLATIIEREAA
jgi:hypothetical protein